MHMPEIRPRRGGKASSIEHASEGDRATVFSAHDEECEAEFTVARGRYAYTDCGCRDRAASESRIPPEVEADADTAFELGRVAGYDEAMREMSMAQQRGEGRRAMENPSDEQVALSDFLFTIYDHGTSPNALREARAILSFLDRRRGEVLTPLDAAIQARDWDTVRHIQDAAQADADAAPMFSWDSNE